MSNLDEQIIIIFDQYDLKLLSVVRLIIIDVRSNGNDSVWVHMFVASLKLIRVKEKSVIVTE